MACMRSWHEWLLHTILILTLHAAHLVLDCILIQQHHYKNSHYITGMGNGSMIKSQRHSIEIQNIYE